MGCLVLSQGFVKGESDCAASPEKMVISESKLNCLNNILQTSEKNLYQRTKDESHRITQ